VQGDFPSSSASQGCVRVREKEAGMHCVRDEQESGAARHQFAREKTSFLPASSAGIRINTLYSFGLRSDFFTPAQAALCTCDVAEWRGEFLRQQQS
jgi:hypothetical protein